MSELGSFETAYISAGLEANGPSITYPLFKMFNAISDGIMIVVIILVSILVVVIAFMCIRFTLLTKMEEDYQEIGVMKAIGLQVTDLKKIYLGKYAAISAVGCIVGFALSYIFRGMLLENIRLFMGESDNSSYALLFGILGIILIFFVIILYVNHVLKRFRKISAASAIRFGISEDKSSMAKHFILSKNRLINTNIFLGIQDVLSRKKLYTTMLLVLMIATFIIIVPQNLYSTISSKEFATYMGIGECDIRIDIQQTNDILDKAKAIAGDIEKDKDITKYTMLTTKNFQAKTEGGSQERIKVELGDHLVFPVSYSEGRAPVKEEEIALSSMNADDFGKTVGDTITLVIGGKEKNLTVCGIYSDVTNGGKTAKATFTDNSAEIMWSILCLKLSDKSIAGSKVLAYATRFDFAKVTAIEEFIKQTFGQTINSIGKASFAAIIVAVLITLFVTLLFMKMLISKDRYSITVMEALGFTSKDIKVQYITRSIFVLIAGVLLGTFFANTLGEVLASMMLSSFGAKSFQFMVNPLLAYLLCPLIMVGSVWIGTIVGTSSSHPKKLLREI